MAWCWWSDTDNQDTTFDINSMIMDFFVRSLEGYHRSTQSTKTRTDKDSHQLHAVFASLISHICAYSHLINMFFFCLNSLWWCCSSPNVIFQVLLMYVSVSYGFFLCLSSWLKYCECKLNFYFPFLVMLLS